MNRFGMVKESLVKLCLAGLILAFCLAACVPKPSTPTSTVTPSLTSTETSTPSATSTATLIMLPTITGRPVMVTEYHIGVPENGLGAGLVQAKDQTERGNAYRYFVEQAASLDGFMGDWWFQWSDEAVLGRMDGENYNIGFIDSTGRAYKELTEAVQVTNKRLYEVHAGKLPPFSQRPKANDAGAPSTPWDLDAFHGG